MGWCVLQIHKIRWWKKDKNRKQRRTIGIGKIEGFSLHDREFYITIANIHSKHH